MNPLPKNIQRWTETPVFRNILLLFSGTGLAQLIPVIIQLFLARIYSKTEFGELSVFMSVIGIGGVIATLNYDYVVVISRKQGEARTMLSLSLLSSILISIFSCLILYVFKPYFSGILNVSDYSILWMAPPVILIMGWINGFTSWYNRLGAYKKMVTGQLTQGLSIPILKLLFGYVGISAGLIWGTFTGYIFAVAYFIYLYLADENKQGLFRSLSWIKMKLYAWEYRDFAIYASIGNLFNAFALLGLPLLITFFYPLEVAGLYFFANSIIRLPINLLSLAIGKVYKKEASEMYQRHPHELYSFTIRIQKMILCFVLPLLVFFFLFGPQLFSFLFGAKWIESGEMIRYFAIFVLFNALYSPISSIADILRHQKLLLFFNVSLVICQIAIFAIGAGLEFKYVLLATSVIGALHYILIDIYMKKQIKKYRL